MAMARTSLSWLSVGSDENRQQVPDLGVDVCCRAGENGVAGLVGAPACGWVRDAPVQSARMVAEAGTGLTGPVAQGDHVVEPAASEGVQVARALVGDLDAEVVSKDPRDIGVQSLLGAGTGADRLHMTTGVTAQ